MRRLERSLSYALRSGDAALFLSYSLLLAFTSGRCRYSFSHAFLFSVLRRFLSFILPSSRTLSGCSSAQRFRKSLCLSFYIFIFSGWALSHSFFFALYRSMFLDRQFFVALAEFLFLASSILQMLAQGRIFVAIRDSQLSLLVFFSPLVIMRPPSLA